MSIERERLNQDGAAWRQWGPYLSERAWGTVREDYSANGDAWNYFPHDHARSRVYRWNEDGLLGFCDDQQRLCFSLALWNGRDPIVKERLFGLAGTEGNHGEDVKEYYFYLDSTPTHSYVKLLYKYPQCAFPYAELIEQNRRRSRRDAEFELLDSGVFDADRYYDILVEYGKAEPHDMLILISAVNRGADAAELHLLPTLWYRNTWNWGDGDERPRIRPELLRSGDSHAPSATGEHVAALLAEREGMGQYLLAFEGSPELLFTENESNLTRLYGATNPSPYVKDGINDYIVDGLKEAVNPGQLGTKAALHYVGIVPPGRSFICRLRLMAKRYVAQQTERAPFADFDRILAARRREADEFYAGLQPRTLSQDEALIQRQAFAGLLCSKQYYAFDVARWFKGDPGQPPPPPARVNGRNKDWMHLNNGDVLSMPDKWEYPWYAAWDLAFHCIPLSLVDAEFAKRQLILLGYEWYQHPNGQVPAYEWNFGDVNPPVLAWAAWRVYTIDRKMNGAADLSFLERVFHKLLLYFTWWVNRKDAGGRNVFQGGFLGLDNIGVFDRSAPLPTGGYIQQSDGTSWMGMFCLNMLTIALELACYNPVYQDIATKFFEHFLYIAAAMNNLGGDGIPLWDEEDQFFYDVLQMPPDKQFPMKVRSMVGLIPLFAVTTLEPDILERLPDFRKRLDWFLMNRPELARLVSLWQEEGMRARHLVALLRGHRLKRLLKRALDPEEFLSPHGIRALSRRHAAQPYMLDLNQMHYKVEYEPGESSTALFGGNSNWRGPVWFPVNYLIIESLQNFHHYFGPDFKVECPTGSRTLLSLKEVADFLSQRLISLYTRDERGRRAAYADNQMFQNDPHWRDYILFYEYFHGETGAGLGASHQTGWTGLIAKLLQQQGERGMMQIERPGR